MDLVVDTNIIFSSLTSSRKIQQLLTRLYREGHSLHTPRELITELERNLDRIARYSPLPKSLLAEVVRRVLPRMLQLHETAGIPEGTRQRARVLVSNVDPSDWPFVALAMHLGAPIWTGDKKLIKLAVETGFKHFTALDTHAVEMLLEGRPWEEILEYLKKKYA